MSVNQESRATNYLNPLEENTVVGFKKIAESVKKFFNPHKFNTCKVPNAHESYLKSRYGTIETNEQRLEMFMSRVCDQIIGKNNINEYALVLSIPDDIVEYTDVILNFFTCKGYVTKELSQIIEGLSHHYLFIGWDNFKSTHDAYIKYNRIVSNENSEKN